MRIFGEANKFYRRGFTIVEVVVVAAIITASILVAAAVAQKSISISRQSLHQAQASFLLEETAEVVRIARDEIWSNIGDLTLDTDYYLSFSGGVWSLSTTPAGVGIFSRKVVFSSAYRDANDDLVSSGTEDSGTRLVTATVSWTEGGQSVTKTLQFYLSDIFSE